MPRGYRCVLVAVVGVAVAGAAPPNQPDQNSAASTNQTEPLAAPYKPYADRYGERCYEAANHDSADLCAQWRAAYAAEKTASLTKWGNIISALGAVLSFASVILILFALRQGRDANLIAKDTAKHQLRAYVGVLTIYLHDRHGGDPRFVTEVQNFGQTPARNVVIHTAISVQPKDTPRPDFFVPPHEFGTMDPGRMQLLISGFGPMNFTNHAAQLATGETNMHLFGMITYFDVYGRSYFKEFTAYISHRRLNNQGPIGASVYVGDEEEGEQPAE